MTFPAHAVRHAYRPTAWLRVKGSDAASFLQGQFTQDVRLTQAGTAIYGLWLDQKGKVLADSFMGRGPAPGEFWIASVHSAGAALRQRLEDYIIADDVLVEDGSAGQRGVALLGEGVGAWLASVPRPGVFFRSRRSGEESWEWIFPEDEAEAVEKALAGAASTSAEALERDRILAGFPSIPSDIGPGDLPNEGGLDADAISYTKGCYLGQEIMARLKSKGRLRRRLFSVQGEGPVPAVPALLWQAGKPAGELRSAVPAKEGVGFVGLALLSLVASPEGAVLALAAEGPPRVTVLGPSR